MVAPERIWTPWRMRYLSGGAREEGCVFCNRFAGDDDVTSLIVHRAETCFVIMNLFPYGSGHVMIVPNHHAADPGELDATTRHEMADLLPDLMRVLQRVLNCEGFNSGFNFGVAGGAGIAEHMHQHVVPRWTGDANFMPIIAATKAIPELLPAQAAKIRIELHRESYGEAPVPVIALVDNGKRVVLRDGGIPVAEPQAGVPLWRSAVQAVQPFMTNIEVIGWAGDARADPRSAIGLTLFGDLTEGDAWPVEDVHQSDHPLVKQALAHLAPHG